MLTIDVEKNTDQGLHHYMEVSRMVQRVHTGEQGHSQRGGDKHHLTPLGNC